MFHKDQENGCEKYGYRGQNERCRSRLSVKVNNTLQNTGYPIRKYTYEVSSKSFHQYPQKTFAKKCFRFGTSWPGEERTIGETL